MRISKGPYHRIHQQHALISVIHARVFNQISIEQVSLFYLTSLNMEFYIRKLTKPKRRRVRGMKKFLQLLTS